MRFDQPRGGWVIMASYVVAFLLTVMPMPEWARYWRPDWVVLVHIYWCMALPRRIGVGVGWSLGIVLDVFKGALFGQHAIGMAIISYVVLQTHQRIRVFPLVQQAIIVFFLITLVRLLVLWVKGIMGHAPDDIAYWFPSIMGMLLWPWVFVILRDLRRRFGIA